MDTEIVHRIQALEFSSVKSVDYLTSCESVSKTDYLIENHLIGNRRRQFYELSEALKNGLYDFSDMTFCYTQ